MSKSMDFKVGIADGQSDGLQVLGIGEPWPIYLEGMEECFILEPLVIQGLSHSVNLGISFLMEHNLKINCTKEEVKDRSASIGRRKISPLYKQEDRKSVCTKEKVALMPVKLHNTPLSRINELFHHTPFKQT